MSALADLNKFEANTRGEFGIGSAAQFGSADLRFISLMMNVYLPEHLDTSDCSNQDSLFAVMQESSTCEWEFQVISISVSFPMQYVGQNLEPVVAKWTGIISN